MDKKTIEFITALYQAKYTKLTQYAYHLSGDWQLAEDLVQHTFSVLMMRADDVKKHDEPEKWVFRTFHNVYNNEKNLKKYSEEILLDEENMVLSSYVHYNGNKDSLSEILPKGLTEEEKEILQWRYGDQLPYDEIADLLGITEIACRKRVSRARKRCGILMGKN